MESLHSLGEFVEAQFLIAVLIQPREKRLGIGT